MNKILVAADGSKFTQKAVEYLVRHRVQYGEAPKLVLMHVNPLLPGRATAALGRETVAKYRADETRKALAPAKKLLDKAGMAYTAVQSVGDAGDEIARYANKGKFTLVIMGSHGHGMLATLVLGSCSSKVLAQSKVPVLIIR